MPEDVSALVDELSTDNLSLQLVSLSSDSTREVIVQAGAFGEHTFSDVEFVDGHGAKSIGLDSQYLGNIS